MGQVPILPPPRSAHEALARFERKWQCDLRLRYSRFAWRRRRAYAACIALIRAREAALGQIADPWLIKAPERYPAQPAPDFEGLRRGQAAA